MNNIGAAKIKAWVCVGGWVFCIYSTLYIVRPICEYLKKICPLGIITDLVMIGILAGFSLYLLCRVRIKNPWTYAGLSCVLLCYGYGLITISFPEEKIHFVEYGFLAYLIYRALRLNLSRPTGYVGAFFLTALLGWIDEGIQHLLPNRYYQLDDVLLNAASGALGLALLFLFEREKFYSRQ